MLHHMAGYRGALKHTVNKILPFPRLNRIAFHCKHDL